MTSVNANGSARTAPPFTAMHRHAGAPHRSAAFIAVCLGNFLVLLDSNIVNLALPSIQRSVGGSLTALSWVANGYTLALAAFVLTGGSIGDRLGHDRALRWGLVGFAVLSLACALAPSLGLLVIARVLQGIGTALLLPSLLALIPQLFTDPRERARAVSMWASSGAAAAAVGPLFGGILVDLLGWRAVFAINLPVVAVAYAVVRRTLPRLPRRTGGRLDLPGQALAVLALTGLCFVLTGGGSMGWTNPYVLVTGLAGALALVVFVRWEQAVSEPLLPLRLFTSRPYRSAVIAGLLWQAVIFGELFVFSVYFQSVQHRGALASGLGFLPMTALAALLPPVVTRFLVPRFGFAALMAAGGAFGLAGCLLILLCDADAPYWRAGLALGLLGLFAALALPSIASLAVTHTPLHLSGTGSAVLNAGRQLGGVLGVAVLGTAAGQVSGSFEAGMRTGAIVAALSAGGVVLLARGTRDRAKTLHGS